VTGGVGYVGSMHKRIKDGCRVRMVDEKVLRRVREKRQRTGALQDAVASQEAPAREISPIDFREYQRPLMDENGPGVVVLHWARQIGKSFTLAAWAVDRLLRKPGRLVTVLSNSRDNGAEFVRKCAEICEKMRQEFECEEEGERFAGTLAPPTKRFIESFRMEVRITVDGQVGRIKVLAANPRTARGFSGDLILDEFAFHEDSAAIWEAAEPILASNPDFKCRIASTGNGRHNMFYRMANGVGSNDGTLFENPNGFIVSRVTRTAAHAMGVKIYDLKQDRAEITPAAARQQAMDKRAYDQNYECVFADENMTLLTYELIAAAQSDVVTIDSQEWSQASLDRMRKATGYLEVGNDIGRNRDLSMLTVIEHEGTMRRVVAMLKLEDMRLPDQQKRVAAVCMMPRFHKYCGDMTGLGLGLIEFLQDLFGYSRIQGVNFASTEPVTGRMKIEGRKQETARVTEIMAVNLLSCFEERSIKDLPNDEALVEDLRKPEKVTSPGGRVSIAATRDEAGHADGFWSLALAVRAGDRSHQPFAYERVQRRHPFWRAKIIF
jgi:phage FluMu gp28-like protein